MVRVLNRSRVTADVVELLLVCEKCRGLVGRFADNFVVQARFDAADAQKPPIVGRDLLHESFFGEIRRLMRCKQASNQGIELLLTLPFNDDASTGESVTNGVCAGSSLAHLSLRSGAEEGVGSISFDSGGR